MSSFVDTDIIISILVGALTGLSLHLQKNYFIKFEDRPNTFFYSFTLISISRMIIIGLFIYNLLHMEYLKGILNGVICIVTLFLLMQKKA